MDCYSEFDEYIAPDGQVYVFDDKLNDKWLVSFTGYGMPELEYITERGPYQHGETLLDYRLRPRIIQLVHRRQAGRRQGYWDNRADILNLLRPNRHAVGAFGPGVLRKRLPNGSLRDLKAIIQQGPVFSARSRDTWDEYAFDEELRFFAGDPTFYDPNLVTVLWAVDDLGGLYFYSAAYPDNLFSPWYFGNDTISAQAILHYTGTWLTYPTIYIIGPLNHPVIENITTGETIEMTYNVAVGEQITIALPFGNKSVVNNAGANLIGTVTTNSNLATFHIAPEPEAPYCATAGHVRPCGKNILDVSGFGGVVGQTQVQMNFNTRYLGI